MPDSDPSIGHEPHLSRRTPAPDSSESRAEHTLSNEKNGDAFAELARHSVFDEPDILPGRTAEIIEADWPCSRCGYNLRGLTSGTRCPECGQIELYRPPPDGAPSMQALRRREMSEAQREWRAAPLVVCAAVCGLAGLHGGLQVAIPSWIAALISGPAIAEFLKVVPLALLVETRPQWFGSAASVRTAAMLGAIVYGAMQSAVAMLIPVGAALPGLWMPLGRLTLCIAMHAACTHIAARGWIEAWARIAADARRFEPTAVIGGLVAAMAVHAGYNAACLFMGLGALKI